MTPAPAQQQQQQLQQQRTSHVIGRRNVVDFEDAALTQLRQRSPSRPYSIANRRASRERKAVGTVYRPSVCLSGLLPLHLLNRPTFDLEFFLVCMGHVVGHDPSSHGTEN